LQLAWAEESIAIQSFDWRSNRQTGGQHLLHGVARSLRAEFLLEEYSKLARTDAEHLGQHLGGVPVAGERGLDAIDLF
jgi:hypothetical protein